MQKLLTLAVVSLLIGCDKNTPPKFPDIKDKFHSVVIVDGVAHCLHHDVVSYHPLLISTKPTEVELINCNMLGGFDAKSTQLLFTWIDDAWEKIESAKQCFKGKL